MSLNSQSHREQPDLNPDTTEVSEAQTEVVETSENTEPTEVIETSESNEPAASSEVDDTAKEPEKIGVVTDCIRLNVREAPSKDAKVLTVIPALTEIKVYLDETTTDDFCKICTAAGIQGFCMKKYITIRH